MKKKLYPFWSTISYKTTEFGIPPPHGNFKNLSTYEYYFFTPIECCITYDMLLTNSFIIHEVINDRKLLDHDDLLCHQIGQTVTCNNNFQNPTIFFACRHLDYVHHDSAPLVEFRVMDIELQQPLAF